jgi:hypothetical protein
MNEYRPEVRLILDSATTSLDNARVRRITNLASRDLDWVYLVCTARAHAVTPVVYRSLASLRTGLVPPPVLEELRQEFYRNTGRNLFLAKELAGIIKIFDGCGIAAIPYKGPVLAAAVYGSLALRAFGDLDILVREQDYALAQRLLSDAGFQLVKAYEHEVTFADPTGRLAVDLHRTMTDREISSPLSFDYLWRHVQPVSLGETHVLGLSPGDTLLMLATQITKDSGSHYFQLAKICDIAELVRRHPGLDLAATLREAKQLGCERMVLYSLGLATRLLGALLPIAIRRAMEDQRVIEPLVDQACLRLFAGTVRSIDERDVSHFRWRIRERLRDKLHPTVRRFARDLITPCELDRRLFPLPAELSCLYYLIRPARLLCKVGVAQAKSAIGWGVTAGRTRNQS